MISRIRNMNETNLAKHHIIIVFYMMLYLSAPGIPLLSASGIALCSEAK